LDIRRVRTHIKAEHKTKTVMTKDQIEALRSVLCRIQKMRKVENGLTIFLVWDEKDWLVIMQCLQDHGLFKSNPKRPPLKAFAEWVQENHVPQLLAECNADEMSLASENLKGERYPWKGVTWKPSILVRWRALYAKLSKMLQKQVEP